jgi:proteasome lid subunit RPN8/RPN11
MVPPSPLAIRAFYHDWCHFPYTVGVEHTVRITRTAFEELLAHARRDPSLECCGLLAGKGGVITRVLSAVNVLSSATAYEIAPAELFKLFHQMRATDLNHLGIYHSHPRGDNAPSPRDIAHAYYPGVAYLIVSPAADAPEAVRAFAIGEGKPAELRIEVVPV